MEKDLLLLRNRIFAVTDGFGTALVFDYGKVEIV